VLMQVYKSIMFVFVLFIRPQL